MYSHGMISPKTKHQRQSSVHPTMTSNLWSSKKVGVDIVKVHDGHRDPLICPSSTTESWTFDTPRKSYWSGAVGEVSEWLAQKASGYDMTLTSILCLLFATRSFCLSNGYSLSSGVDDSIWLDWILHIVHSLETSGHLWKLPNQSALFGVSSSFKLLKSSCKYSRLYSDHLISACKKSATNQYWKDLYRFLSHTLTCLFFFAKI